MSITVRQRTARTYKRAREQAGVSAQALAEALGITRNAIYHRESGLYRITSEMVLAQAVALGAIMKTPEWRQARSAFISGKQRGRPVRKLAAFSPEEQRDLEAEAMTPPDTVQQNHDSLRELRARIDALAAAAVVAPDMQQAVEDMARFSDELQASQPSTEPTNQNPQ